MNRIEQRGCGIHRCRARRGGALENDAPLARLLGQGGSFIFARTSYTSRQRKLAVSAIVRPLHPCFTVRDNERAESSFLKTRKILLNITRAWRERADEAEKKIKRQCHCRIRPAHRVGTGTAFAGCPGGAEGRTRAD